MPEIMVEIAVLRRFEELIRARSGIQMRPQETALLGQTLSARVQARRMASATHYLDFLSAPNTAAGQEWKALFVLLTNQESYFFRDSEQLAVIRDHLLPEILRRNREKRALRIWSAGCSTGEEPYSLAMMLDEVLPFREGWRVLILGTDLSEAALERARRGVYGAWSFRALEGARRERFFTPRGKEWEVKPRLRESVHFAHGNLFDDEFPNPATELHDIDLILCRNVFIYFGADAVARVLPKFSATLRPEGFLVVGHAELHGANLGDLEARSFPQSVVYQRGQVAPESTRAATKRDGAQTDTAPVAKPVSVTRPSNATIGMRAQNAAVSVPKANTNDDKDEAQAAALIQRGQHEAALQLLQTLVGREPENLAGWCLMAQAQANLGRLDEAEASCGRASAVSPFAPLPYQVLARIAAERGNDADAKTLLKKVIYLHPSCLRAYLELSALYEREGDAPRAAQMTRAALGVLGDQSDEALVPPDEYAVEEALSVGEIKRQMHTDSAESRPAR